MNVAPPNHVPTSQQPRGAYLARATESLSRSRYIWGLSVAVLLVSIGFALANPNFFSTSNLGNIAEQITILGIIATGLTFAIVSGEIDLSVGATYGVCTIVFALALENSWTPLLAVVATIAAGALMGLINGGLGIALGVPTIIITLGTLNLFRGIALWLSGGFPVSDFPETGLLFDFGLGRLIDLGPLDWFPDLGLALIVVAILGQLALNETAFGTRVKALGSNRDGARDVGIRIASVRLQTLVLVGVCAGVAGVLSVARFGSASPSAGATLNLDAVAAVIVGGAAIFGGRGSVVSSVLGALLIGIVRNGLVLAHVDIYGQTMVSGLIIIVAVAVDKTLRGETWHRSWWLRLTRKPAASDHNLPDHGPAASYAGPPSGENSRGTIEGQDKRQEVG